MKYEDTLRRFNIYIREDGIPDISFNALRSKICSLFQLNLNSDIIITYTDEDNDIINMVDEDDLLEAVRQRLNPLRLEVWITCQKGDTQSNNAIPNGGTQSNNGTTATLKEQEQENGNNCKFLIIILVLQHKVPFL